ncbi:MAG: hypothetical protein C0407_08940 [Desulfobacca sp.]|nr:hypothetical protein [Desulfobacca sp.]
MESQVHEAGNSSPSDIDYLVFSVKDFLLALPYVDIIQIIDSPTCTAVPNMPNYFRGVIDLMGEALPLIDTRIKLSIPSRQEEVSEFVKIFMMRKQDHLNWINKLKNAVNNDEKITVEKDPHKCAFGKWYDTYIPSTLALASYMKRFDIPHKAIHYLAVQAEELIQAGQKEQAKLIIQTAENKELLNLIKLFDGFEEQMKQSYHEYAIVVAHKGRKYSLSVDAINYFEKMDEIVHKLPFLINIDEKIISGIGRKKVGDKTEDVIILNLERFLNIGS